MNWFMIEVPPMARLLLAMLLFVGITVTVVALFHQRIVALGNGAPWPPPANADELSFTQAHEERGLYEPPPPDDLAGRIITITGTAFVFLLAFTLSNFWSNAQDARTALQTEVADFNAALVAARLLPQGQERDEVLTALENYRQDVVEQEWPLLQRADSAAALAIHHRASVAVAGGLILTPSKSLKSAESYSEVRNAVLDMVDKGNDRINALPRSAAPSVVMLIFLLGLCNLAVAAAFLPSSLQTNLFLIGAYAAIIGFLIFIVVEASNPFVGGGQVLPVGFS